MSEASQYPNGRFVIKYVLYTVSFGLAIGAIFPIFTTLFAHFNSISSRDRFIVVCLAAGLLVGLFSFLIARLVILRVVNRIGGRIGDMCEQEGGLSSDIPLYSPDCLGVLITNFNRFQRKMREMVENLRDTAEKTQMIGLELAANTTETSAASEQIARHMQQIHEQTETLMQEVDTVDFARMSINDSAQQVSNDIDNQSTALTRLSALIEGSVNEVRRISTESSDRIEAIVETTHLARQGIEEMAQVVRKMDEIYRHTLQIGEVINSIEEVASQISILGINASIQASHSGDAGRGFAVVASEIRKLSAVAGKSSKSIILNVNSVVDLVRNGVSLASTTEGNLHALLERISNNVADIRDVSQRVAKLGDSVEEMLRAHSDLVKTTIEVTNAMVDMHNNTKSIGDSMKTLIDTANENKRAIDEISLAMTDIAAEVQSLNQVSVMNAESVKTLKWEVGKFKIGS